MIPTLIDELALPTGRLERPQLEQVAQTIAARREIWTPHLDLTAGVRTYASLHRDADLDVWALFWLPDNDTGWHDHDVSSGAVHVVSGSIEEHALLHAAPDRHRSFQAGATFSFGPSHIHRMTCQVPRAVTIHAYSPPLWRLGQYSTDGDGALHRQSISYADELRPIEDLVAA